MKIESNVTPIDNDIKHIITKNLHYLRSSHSLSAERVAKVLNVSRQAYSNYENGIREISISGLKILADFYGITLDMITSHTLIGSNAIEVKFHKFELKDGELTSTDDFMSISNPNMSLISVKVDALTTKIYETTTKFLHGHEMLVDFKGKLKMGKVYLEKEILCGTLIDTGTEEPLSFTKKQAMVNVIPVGILLATIKKEYEKNNFF